MSGLFVWSVCVWLVLLTVAVATLWMITRQLRQEIDRLKRITRPANVQVTSTGGGGGSGAGSWPRNLSGPGIQVFESGPGAPIRKVWPPEPDLPNEPPANT